MSLQHVQSPFQIMLNSPTFLSDSLDVTYFASTSMHLPKTGTHTTADDALPEVYGRKRRSSDLGLADD